MLRYLIAILLLLVSPASAQQVNLFWACGSGLTTWCPVNNANPIPVTATVTPPALQNVNLTQVGSVAVATGHGTAAGVLRVELPTDGTGLVNAAQSGTWNIGSIATLPALVAGSAIIGNVRIDQTTPGTTNAVSLAQLGGTTVSTGLGVAGAGVLRVTLASDGPLGSTSGVFGAILPTSGIATGLVNGTGNMFPLASGNLVGDAGDASRTLAVNAYNYSGSVFNYTRGDAFGTYVVAAPSSATAVSIVPVICGSAVSSCVLSAAAANLYSVYAECSAACWLLVFNATAAPSNGATTAGIASGNLVECIPINAGGIGGLSASGMPPSRYSVGITATISSTTCATLTLATTGFIKGLVK